MSFEFIPSLGTILGFSLASFALSITPGPDMALFLARTVTGGRPLGFAAMFGASAGLIVHATLAGLGLSALLAASANAFFMLKIIGGLYLVWLAYGAIRHGSGFSIDQSKVPQQTLFGTFLTGVGIESHQSESNRLLRDVPSAICRCDGSTCGRKAFVLGSLLFVNRHPDKRIDHSDRRALHRVHAILT